MALRKLTKEVVIILLIIAAALIYLVLQRNDHTYYSVPKLEPIDQKGLTRLVIEKSDETVELENRNGNWTLSEKGYQTDKEKVQKALDTIASLRLSELISRSGNDILYDLAEDKRIRVSLYKEETLLRQIDLGKVSATYRHTFVRLKDGPEVYQAPGSLRSDFDNKSGDWRDKAVFKIDSNEVTAVKINTMAQTYEFTKAVTQTDAAAQGTAGEAGPVPPAEAVSWNIVGAGTGTVKKDAIDSVLTKLADLRCDRFAAEETESEEVQYEITIQASTPHSITLYKADSEDATEILARSSQSPYLFYLSKWTVDSLKKTESDLFDISPDSSEKK